MVVLNAGPLAPLAVVAVLGALAMVTAQSPPPPELPLPTKTTTTRTLSRIVISVAMIAFFVLVLIGLFFVLCAQVPGAGERRGESIRRHRRRGPDLAALDALPIVPYAEIKKHRSGGELECAVCLTAFEDGDELRLLPQCSHAFHPDCVDSWLEVHVTCPLCRANLEKPAPAVRLLPPPETNPQTSEAVAVEVDMARDEEEAVELKRLRCARRAARMQRWHTMGHAPSTTTATREEGDHHRDRFTVRLPPHVHAEVLKSRRLRHTTSLVVRQSCAGSASCQGGDWSWHGARRRWTSFLTRTPSWARGSSGDVGTVAAGWPTRCIFKSGNLV